MTDQAPRRSLLTGWSGRAAVMLLSVFIIGRGLAYVGPLAPDGAPSILGVIDNVLPTPVWGIVYIVAALLIIAGMWVRQLWSPGLILWAVVQTVWIVGYLAATVSGLAPRGWVTACAIGPGLLLAALLLYLGPPPKGDDALPPKGDDAL